MENYRERMDKANQSVELPPRHILSPEVVQEQWPKYPILDVAELGDAIVDIRDQLSPEDQARLRPHEMVVHIHRRELRLPDNPVTAEEIVMKAAHADSPDQIGDHGPTVASVNIFDDGERSRYEDPHGRDDTLGALDTRFVYPKLIDTSVRSLLELQCLVDEPFIPGQPYGFGKPGAIILLNKDPGDPIGQKFQKLKDWRYPFNGSADAPGLTLEAMEYSHSFHSLHSDIDYLNDLRYLALDGHMYPYKHGFDLAIQWHLDRMVENVEGLVEYRNPYANGRGMRNQGWKDSADAMVHTDGTWVNSQGGVAPIEIQAQTVVVFKKAAEIYRGYGDDERASQLDERADELLGFILEEGWVEDERGGYFAMGWDRDEDGSLRRIETRSIDMYQVLRILDMDDPKQREMAYKTVRTLTSEEMFTRWGSRVMSSREKAYGDLRYHCGVWPDKSNRVAEAMAHIGLFGLDRVMGGRTTDLLTRLGCVPEHISGEDSEEPTLPQKDIYVYNTIYHELHLMEQVPPLGQTWGATSEIGKKHRYESSPLRAITAEAQKFEAEIIRDLRRRYGDLIESA